MTRRTLDPEALAEHLAAAADWTQHDKTIARTFRFGTYAQAVKFTNGVAAIAERLDHHPDILLGWGRVEVTFTTHDAGGLTRRDFEAAREVDKLARDFEGLIR